MVALRVSFCQNAGKQRGRIAGTGLLRFQTAAASPSGEELAQLLQKTETMARNKLKIGKKKAIILYEHKTGMKITKDNLSSILCQHDVILNVSFGEAFIAKDGTVTGGLVSSGKLDLPRPPRWPAPFGRDETAGRGVVETSAVGKRQYTLPLTATLSQDNKDDTHSISVNEAKRLTPIGNQSEALTTDKRESLTRKGPFIDLSGDVANHFKQLARSNPYLVMRHHDEHISVDYSDVAAFTNNGAESRRSKKNDSLYLEECRGLLLSPIDGRVLARRFHKFYNVFENRDAIPDNLHGTLLLEKLDGCLVSPFMPSPVGEDVFWATRQERNLDLEKLICNELRGTHYNDFARLWLSQGYTPLFECISSTLHNSIVPYDGNKLILLALRHTTSGVYAPWKELVEAASLYGIPLPRVIRKIQDESLDEILTYVQGNQMAIDEKMEGIVMVLADGQRRFKIKTHWYLNHTAIAHGNAGAGRERNKPFLLQSDALVSSHWSNVPTQYVWEIALWDWLNPGTENYDDWLALAVNHVHKSTQCPIDVLLYFVDSVRSSVLSLDNELTSWARSASVASNPELAGRLLRQAGWPSQVIMGYFAPNTPKPQGAKHFLASFLLKMVKQGKSREVKLTLRQSFVYLADLYTDPHLLLHNLLPSFQNSIRPTVIIMRGIPGSGKSHLVQEHILPFLTERIEKTKITICSADHYFMEPTTGRYNFDVSKLHQAHEYCRNKFVASASHSIVRIVDNTNTTLGEYQFYKRKAGGDCRVIVLDVRATAIETSNGTQNVHQVPDEVVQRLKNRWEEDPNAILVRNFWLARD